MKKLLSILSLFITSLAFGQSSPILPNNYLWGNFSGGQGPAQGYPALLIGTGNSGGVLCYTGTNVLASSPTLSTNGLVIGGGVGNCPQSLSGTGIVSLSSGAASVLTYLPASAGGCGINVNPNSTISNTACGSSAGLGITGINNTAFGNFSLTNASTGNSDTAYGYGSCDYVGATANQNSCFGSGALNGTNTAPITGNSNSAFGFDSLYDTQGATSNNSAFGAYTCYSNTTGLNNLCLGYGVGYTGMGTGNYNIIVGVSTSCTISTTSTSNELDICGNSTPIVKSVGNGTPATSTWTFYGKTGFTGHVISAQTALTTAALSSCGTTPAISSNSSDIKGTITEGTTATGCTLTFATAYSTAPDCIVSSPNGAAFTSYTPSTTTLVIVNASASGNKYSYFCEQ